MTSRYFIVKGLKTIKKSRAKGEYERADFWRERLSSYLARHVRGIEFRFILSKEEAVLENRGYQVLSTNVPDGVFYWSSNEKLRRQND